MNYLENKMERFLNVHQSTRKDYDRFFKSNRHRKIKLSDLQLDNHKVVKKIVEGKKATFKDFKILKKFSDGISPVYLCTHNDNFGVVIKSILKGVITNARIVEEVNNLRLFDHPNIVQLYDYFQDDHNFYIVMEYAGENLSDHQVAFDENFTKSIFKQAILAIEECHRKNVIHRDIKVENFVLDKNGVCKLIDFGLSVKLEKGATSVNSHCLIGTLECLSPEIASKSPYSKSTDVWSLGIFLYEFFTKKSLFDPEEIYDDEEVRSFIRNITYEFSPSLTLPLKNLLKKILVHQPKRLSLNAIKKHPWVTSF